MVKSPFKLRKTAGNTTIVVVLLVSVVMAVGGLALLNLNQMNYSNEEQQKLAVSVKRTNLAAIEFLNQLIQSNVILPMQLPPSSPYGPGLILLSAIPSASTMVNGSALKIYDFSPGTAGALSSPGGPSTAATFTPYFCQLDVTTATIFPDVINLANPLSSIACTSTLGPKVTVTDASSTGGVFTNVEVSSNVQATTRVLATQDKQGFSTRASLELPPLSTYTPSTCTVAIRPGNFSSLSLNSSGTVCTYLEMTIDPPPPLGGSTNVSTATFSLAPGAGSCAGCSFAPSNTVTYPANPVDVQACFTQAGNYTYRGMISGVLPNVNCTNSGTITVSACSAKPTQITASGQIDPSSTDFTKVINVKQFDPGLGTLTQVDLNYELNFTAQLADPSGCKKDLDETSKITMTVPGEIPNTFNEAWSMSTPATAGAPPATYANTDKKLTSYSTPSTLAAFIGTGFVPFNVTTLTSYQLKLSGCGASAYTLTTQVGVPLSVTYSFIPKCP